jgi:tetratricopeptide (TPR) repeat protein
MAQAALHTAQVGADAAQIQYQITLDSARLADLAARTTAWEVDLPNEFDQPVWYFEKSEEIKAAEVEVDVAWEVLQVEVESFNELLKDANNDDLLKAEERLANARAAYLVAQDVLDRAKAQSDDELDEFAQSNFDVAEAELEAAQSDYDRLLSQTATEDVLEARARLAVAQERYDTALDHLNQLLTGDESRQVQAATASVEQADAAAAQAEVSVRQAQDMLVQAQKAVAQAQAELDLIDVQIGKLTVFAASSGVVISRNVQPGEVIQVGAPVLTIGQLDNLTITVYVPEDRYGQIKLGQDAWVTVDSFPGETFYATVVYIADKAEFTPRNVQTAEGRRTTVFAVELAIEDVDGKLKPGMPADVSFGE